MSYSLIDKAAGSLITDGTNSTGSFFFDTATDENFNNTGRKVSPSGSSMYAGRNYSSATPSSYVFGKVQIWGSNDQGYIDGTNPSVTINVRGKNSNPASASDGTLIGTTTFTDTSNESTMREIFTTDTANSYSRIWVEIVDNSTSGNGICATEIRIYQFINDGGSIIF